MSPRQKQSLRFAAAGLALFVGAIFSAVLLLCLLAVALEAVT